MASVTDLFREAVMLMLMLSLPVLGTILLTALVVSLLQAVTQIQETTLSLVPKMFAAAIALLLTGPWMFERLVDFSRHVFATLP